MAENRQAEFSFEPARGDGLSRWRAERRRQQEELARSLGLPLGKEAEVWLAGGVRLRGIIQLEEDALIHAQITQHNTRFKVGGVPFSYSEIESCVRMD